MVDVSVTRSAALWVPDPEGCWFNYSRSLLKEHLLNGEQPGDRLRYGITTRTEGLLPKVHPTFSCFTEQATGGRDPYGYQSRLAEQGLPDVLTVPTGAGKTLAAVLPWLYRRVSHPDPAVRAATPRWLVFVLPQRTLVEQTVTVIEGWLANLGLDVPVHLLMGGEDPSSREWQARPARERIFVGTQDMVLSRLLMRGFAEFRSSWPMSFGLLHAGVQFVFDEVQLMGPGLPTSLQLQGLREALGTATPCHSMWMSATLEPTELSSVDFRRELSVVELDDTDRTGPLRTRLDATRGVHRAELGDPDTRRYPRALAERIAAEHRAGTRTLAVLNTVARATATFDELDRIAPDAKLVLLHSLDRPGDRRNQTCRGAGRARLCRHRRGRYPGARSRGRRHLRHARHRGRAVVVDRAARGPLQPRRGRPRRHAAVGHTAARQDRSPALRRR
ncbi:hypothetical protein BH18ACT7_BH18ACT7_23790 [soil metagenome]